MELPKIETAHSGQTKVQEQEAGPEPEPNPKDSDQVANGQGNEAGPVKGSESDSQVQAELSVLRTTPSGTVKKSVRWNPELVTESTYQPSPQASRSYLSYSPSFSVRDTYDNVRNVIGRWRKRVGEATRKAENLAGNTWQHLKTSPSFSEAAIGRIAQGTKVLVEGGYEKIFRLTFETIPEEKLQNCYACYLSTSAGPVMGVLYISTAKVAYSSDNPLSYKSDNRTEWSYYKVVIPLNQLKAVNPSSSNDNPSEKYIQVTSLDEHEFWFMGFLDYEGAVNCLQEAYQTNKAEAT